jgi:hypothetical protein
MQPPTEINVLDKLGGFTAATKSGTLYRGSSIAKKLLKKGSVGKLACFNDRSFYQNNPDVTVAYYNLPGYGYWAVVWFDNKTRRRIA